VPRVAPSGDDKEREQKPAAKDEMKEEKEDKEDKERGRGRGRN
jgi:hypothetical protein